MIPYGRQSISEVDCGAVLEALRSDWLTTGPLVERFEFELSKKVSANYGIAVSSATAALHLSCLALDVGLEMLFGPHRIPLSHQQIALSIVVLR